MIAEKTNWMMYIPLHEKPYFENLGISWKVQKHQVNVIYSSTFLARRRDRIFHHQKVENKNFPVISKYDLSINFLAQKRPYFPSPNISKKELFRNQYTWYSMLKKICYCFFFFSFFENCTIIFLTSYNIMQVS